MNNPSLKQKIHSKKSIGYKIFVALCFLLCILPVIFAVIVFQLRLIKSLPSQIKESFKAMVGAWSEVGSVKQEDVR